MAYDQHNAYEPPRRKYLERAQPSPAPTHSQYDKYADYASTPFDNYDQGHGQGYEQQNGGYDQRQDHGYNDGHGRPAQHAAEVQYDYNQDRQYDPRYQPRAQQQPSVRGPPPHQRMPPPREPYRADMGGHSGQNGQHMQARPPPRDQYEQDNGYQQRGSHAYEDNSGRAPQQAQSPPKAPGKLSMEDWKAQERAKLKSDGLSPETLPFDNAFPVFGAKTNRPESGQSQDRRNCGSKEQNGRPRTANSQTSQGYTDSALHNDAGSHTQRPETEHNHTYPDAANGSYDSHGYQREYGRTSYEKQPFASHGPLVTPDEKQYSETWPMVSGQTPPKAQQAPRQSNGYESSGHSHHENNSRRQRGPPPMQHADTGYAQRNGNRNNQPLSPVDGPLRPSTTHDSRPHVLDQMAMERQPLSANDAVMEVPRKPWAEVDSSRPASVRDILDDYGAGSARPEPSNRNPKTREEEIESEMPDFDSAAPDQGNVNKRVQNLALNGSAQTLPNGHGQSQAPSHINNGLPSSSSLPDVRYDDRGYQPNNWPPPGPRRGPPPRGMTADGYGGGRGPPPGQQYGSRGPYGGPPRPDPRMPHGGPMQPPRAPYANEPPVRRSLDDGRPMPRRNGPPPPAQGRFYGTAPPPLNGRGGPVPRRPDLDRMGTAETAYSDPGQYRAGTAPPSRQGMLSPPGMPPDRRPPLSQQRSAPEGQRNPANPDSLPRHPVPVRPGLMEQGQPQPTKPPPARNYSGSGPPPPQHEAGHQRQPSMDHFAHPVTHDELSRLRASVDASNSPKQALIFVQKLVEAASVLASEGGRADHKTTAKNRENFIMEAHKRLKRIVQGGYPDAQFYFADCYGQGMLGLEPDTKEAFKLYQAAAKGGHAEAAYRTAVCCEMGAEEGGGTTRDYPKAVQWYRRAAALGNGPAMYKLGAITLKGLLGQQRNITEAVIWLKRGVEKADADHPHALHELAQLYESSNTNPEIRNKVVADDNYARELYQQAAGLGYKFSQFRLGQAHEYGQLGLSIDNRTSIAYYTKAAAQGEHQAELALSGWYLTGAEGILEHSDTEAYLWARKAAGSEPPLAKAMFAMGYFTENGIGCPKSLDEAKKWYGRAASYRFPKALERLEELRKGPSKGSKAAPANGKLTRKDQKKDEENCVVM